MVYDAYVAQLDSGEIALFAVMALLDSPTLDPQRPENLDQILALTRQLCRGLDHAYQNQNIHANHF